jgi:hypothetical protein
METPPIEILGQKLSYPQTKYGAMAVFFFCTAITAIAYIALTWATPENMGNLHSLLNTSNAERADLSSRNTELMKQIDVLETTNKKLEERLAKISEINISASEIPAAYQQLFEQSAQLAKEAEAERMKLASQREAELKNAIAHQKARLEMVTSIADAGPKTLEIQSFQGQQQQQLDMYIEQLDQVQQQIQQQR